MQEPKENTKEAATLFLTEEELKARILNGKESEILEVDLYAVSRSPET